MFNCFYPSGVAVTCLLVLMHVGHTVAVEGPGSLVKNKLSELEHSASVACLSDDDMAMQ